MKLRLKELRLQKNLTQAQAGQVIYVNQSMYSRYERGLLDVPLDSLAKLAEFYNVSVDYIAGLTDIPDPYIKSKRRYYYER